MTSGRIAELILGLMAVEAVALLVLWYKRRQGVAPIPLLANMAAGGSLVLALHAALTGGSSTTLAALLLLSLVAHVVDLAARWRRRGT